MHLIIQLFAFWALAFATLCIAVLLLNIFYSLISNDLELHSIGKEAGIAGIASLVEGASIWLVILFVPFETRALAFRALIIPIIIVALIYKIAHLEDWNRYDILLLLMFQIVISCVGACLLFGHFETAIIVLGAFAVILAVFASFAKNL